MDGRTDGCDVAIIDIFLRKGSGLGVLEHMAGYERPPKRVVLTNYATLDMRSRCRALGADAVFDKSTEVDELIDWLDTTNVRHYSCRGPCRHPWRLIGVSPSDLSCVGTGILPR